MGSPILTGTMGKGVVAVGTEKQGFSYKRRATTQVEAEDMMS